VGFLKIRPAELNLITISVSQDGENKMELSIGLSETHGEAIGEREEISD